MKMKCLVLFAIFGILFSSIRPVRAEVNVGVNLFFGDLAPYGTWVSVPAYGEVWYPHHPGPRWRPYLAGHWVWSDEGWVWDSDEPWGWVTYHYGRWVYDPMYGWLWVPGAVWAPAWVAWYTGPNYIGWVPLGPVASVRLSPNFAVFVSWGSFFSPNMALVAVPFGSNVTIIRNETFINNVTVVNGEVEDLGPSITLVSSKTHVHIGPVHVVTRELDPKSVSHLGRNVDTIRGGNFEAFRPRVTADPTRNTPFVKRESEKGIVQAGNRRLSVKPSLASRIKSMLHRGEPEKVRARPNAAGAGRHVATQKHAAMQRHAATQKHPARAEQPGIRIGRVPHINRAPRNSGPQQQPRQQRGPGPQFGQGQSSPQGGGGRPGRLAPQGGGDQPKEKHHGK